MKQKAAGSALQEVSVMYFLSYWYLTVHAWEVCGRLPLGDMQSCADTPDHTLCYVQHLNVAAHCIFWVHKTSALFSHHSKLICLKKS